MSDYYVDPINGSNSNNGTTVTTPRKTLASIFSLIPSSGTHRVYAFPGIYRETVSRTLISSETVALIGLGSCIVDGESSRQCFVANNAGIAFICNFRFRNPSGTTFFTSQTEQSVGAVYTKFYNCTFWWDTQPGGTSQFYECVDATATGIACQGHPPIFVRCTFRNMTRVVTYTLTGAAGTATAAITFQNCIVHVSDSTDPFLKINVSGGIGQSVTVTDNGNARPGAGSLVNITTTAPPYTDDTYPDPDLSLNYAGANIASYRRAGGGFPSGASLAAVYTSTLLANIGAEWNPVFGVDTAFKQLWAGVTDEHMDLGGSAPVTDPNYINGTTQGQAIRQDDSLGDHWEIDTQTTPSAVSAAVVYPVYYIPIRTGSTAYLRKLICEAEENTVPASGSKQVVDSTQAGSGRTVQYRTSTTIFTQTASSPAWTDLDVTTDGAVALTASCYVQARVIFRIDGT